MRIFGKLVDETQISKPQEYTVTFKQNLTCIFISVRVNLKETFQSITDHKSLIGQRSQTLCLGQCWNHES